MSQQDSEHSSSAASEVLDRENETPEQPNDETDFNFESDAAADAVRKEGLSAYNAGRYDEALDHQYRAVRYFSKKYGATNPICGKYFLDYGLSQLRVLQSQKSVEDALQPRDEDALETCFINLEVARVCLQKPLAGEQQGEEAMSAATQRELMLAEVHGALAQLCVEKEDFDGALREYEAELIVYRTLQADDGLMAVAPGRIVAVLYGIADCFVKECDFDGAEERLQATLDEIAKYPAGTIADDLVAELKDRLEDAREMKGGAFKKIQASIQEQIVGDCESMPTAHEFYNVEADATPKHPYMTSMPSGEALREGSFLSMPMAPSGNVLGLPTENSMGGHSNSRSQSISLFPPQGSRSGGGPVHHTVARKKPKVPAASAAVEPEAKKVRTE